MNRAILSLVAIYTLGSFARAAETHDDSFTKDSLFKADAGKLTDTQLVASPDLPFDPAKNVLWCGTLQLSWNEAVKLIGGKIHLLAPSPEAEALNRSEFTRDDLDPASYVAVADFERNRVEQEIRTALEKTFGGAASPELIPTPPTNPGPEDFVAYSYLYKNLAFVQPFSPRPFAFEGVRVDGFGFDRHADESVASQVIVHDYESPDDFILSFATKSPDDELIMAKVTPGPTLAATMQSVLDRIRSHPSQGAGPLNYLDVPKLNFDLRRRFPELEGRTVPDPVAKIKNSFIVKTVEQLVRFQLNEKGAVLKSEAVMIVVGAAMPVASHPLVFDKPFLILLKQKESPRPYFALWIGNPSLLVAAKADAPN